VPHRGWWLVTSVDLVVDARLSASEPVLVGVAQSLVTLVFEVPAGVLADTVSRKWSLVASHALMGTAMLTTGLVTGFGPLVATQLLWGCRGRSPAAPTSPGSPTSSTPRRGSRWCCCARDAPS
jgi:Transmembrane secretion effector